jgi:hypothetical protein
MVEYPGRVSAMSENLRFAFVILASIVLGSCSSAITAISGDSRNIVSAEPIQYEFPASIRKTPESPIEQVTLTPLTADAYVDVRQYLGYVLLDSGKKCQQFADRLSSVQRGVDTSFDVLTTILSALATAFTPLSTVHALTAGASISTGTKLAIDADVYAKATAALILQEIDRTYYVKVQDYGTKLSARQDVDKIIPTIEVSEIEAIHRKCSLDAAIASLTQTGAVAAATIGAATGAAAGAAATGEAATGAIAGALAGATAGATAAGAPAASQAAAMAGTEAGRKAVTSAPGSPSTGRSSSAGPVGGLPSSRPVTRAVCTNVSPGVADGISLLRTRIDGLTRDKLKLILENLKKIEVFSSKEAQEDLNTTQQVLPTGPKRSIVRVEILLKNALDRFICTPENLDKVKNELDKIAA